MTQEVKDENGVIHEFPDEATPEQMTEALKSHSDQSSGLDKFNYITGGNRTPVDTLRDAIAGVISGLGKGGQSIATFATGGRAPTVNFDELVAPIASQQPSFGGDLVKGISSYAPYALAGGASIPGMMAAGAAHGAATTEPEETNLFNILPKGKLGGAIEGALLNMLTPAALKTAESLRPSKLFRGQLSPEELMRNVDITKNTETGLGDVIESPFLKKRLENTLTSIPFSGANESLQRTGKEVVNRGENIMSDLLGDVNPHEIPQKIAEDLHNNYKYHEQQKIANYDKFNQLADQEKLKLDLPNFSNLAKKYSSAIESSNLLKSDPDANALLKRLENYKNPVSQTGILGADALPSVTYPSAKEALLLKGKLNALSKQASYSSDAGQRGLSKVFSNLASTLGKDIKNTVSASENPKLINALNVAEENYAKNYSPFLDEKIFKYLSGDKPAENIVADFVKNSKNADLAHDLTKLSKNISEESRQHLAYAYLSKAIDNEGKLNPSKLGTAIEQLGHNQFKALVPDPLMRQRLRNFSKLQGMNKEAQYLMFNPKTGQRNSDTLMTGLLAMLGNMGAGTLGATAATALPIIAGKAMTKALTSESFRNALVEEMIKNRTRFNTPAKRILGTGLTQGIANKLEGNG